jgi:REP element-mobilizing transposase RayT
MDNVIYPQRKRLRLQGFDYRTPGAYFITLCTEHRAHLFGTVEAGQMRPNAAGEMVLSIWSSIPEKFVDVQLDEFVVMPNHIHFLIWMAWTLTTPPSPPEHSLIEVMRWFKSLSTAKYRQGVADAGWPAFPGKLWQRSYYDHIVRDQAALDAIRRYIAANPARWTMDLYNAERRAVDPMSRTIWQMLNGNR